MSEYKVIDNFLSEDDFALIKNKIMGNDFPWFYKPFVSYEDKDDPLYYFTHVFYHNDNINSSAYDTLKPFLDKLGANYLLRVQGNLYPNINEMVVNKPHVDFDFYHHGAILYLNSNNGYTILEDGTKIESVENRVLLLDTSKLHHSTNCTDEKIRVNIIVNFV